jgi:hypothetical protein
MKRTLVKLLLWVGGIIGVLAVTGIVWLKIDPDLPVKLFYIPNQSFEEDTPDPQRDYSADGSWAALPERDDPYEASPISLEAQHSEKVDVFFVHSTTYNKKAHWNAPVGDKNAEERVQKYSLKLQATIFEGIGDVFAPYYRQATIGAFFEKTGEGPKAWDFAYPDVLAAFDNFIAERNQGRAFILAGHSQGALHLISLLKDRIGNSPLAKKMVAAYIIGWPISIEEDINSVRGIHPCKSAIDTNCVVSFQTFGPAGDVAYLPKYFEDTIGNSGKSRGGSTMLCTDPLSWSIGGSGDKSSHLGAALLDPKTKDFEPPIPNFTGTRCENGILYVTDMPGERWHKYGENFHIHDYNMFYMNLRENAAERVSAYRQRANDPECVTTTGASNSATAANKNE